MFKFTKITFLAIFLWSSQFAIAQNIAQHVPADYPIVFSMDLQNLNKKINLLELQQYDFYDVMLSQLGGMPGDEIAAKLLSEPSSLGIDVMKPVYVVADINQEEKKFAMILSLLDKNRFLETAKGIIGSDNFETQSVNGYDIFIDKGNVGAIKGNMLVLAEAKKKEVYDIDEFYYDEEYIEEAEPAEGGMDDYAPEMPDFDEEIEEDVPDSLEELTEDMDPSDLPALMPKDFVEDNNEDLTMTKNMIDQIMLLPVDRSILQNAPYQRATNGGNDFYMWLDYSTFMDQMNDNTGYGGMSSEWYMDYLTQFTSEIYKDTYYGIGLNFKDGKVAMDVSQFANNQINQLTNQSFDSKYNKKMMKYLRGSELLGLYHLNMSTDKMVDAYKNIAKDMVSDYPGFGDLGVSALEVLGLFMEEDAIADLFEGEMVFAVTGVQKMMVEEVQFDYDDDFNPVEKVVTVEKEMPEMTFMMTYRNQESLQKIVDIGVKSGLITQKGSNYEITVPESGMTGTMTMKKGILFITNSNELVASNFKKKYRGKKGIGKSLCQKLNSNAQTVFFDIPQTITTYSEMLNATPLAMGNTIPTLKETFESITVQSDKATKNGAHTTEMAINFKKENENALKTLFEMFNKMFLEMMGQGESKT